MLRERPFSIFITGENLPPLRYGQYLFYVWHEQHQPRGFAIVFPDGEAAGGVLDSHIEETENQRLTRMFSVEQLLTWLQSQQSQPLPLGWRVATDNESSVILHDWRQNAS